MGGVKIRGRCADALWDIVGGDGHGDEQHGAVFAACCHGDAFGEVVQHNGGDHEEGGTAGGRGGVWDGGQEAVQRQHAEDPYGQSGGTGRRGAGGKAFRDEFQKREGEHGSGGKGQQAVQQTFPAGQQHPYRRTDERPQHRDHRYPQCFPHGKPPLFWHIY